MTPQSVSQKFWGIDCTIQIHPGAGCSFGTIWWQFSFLTQILMGTLLGPMADLALSGQWE